MSIVSINDGVSSERITEALEARIAYLADLVNDGVISNYIARTRGREYVQAIYDMGLVDYRDLHDMSKRMFREFPMEVTK